jgi:hypothetical protein
MRMASAARFAKLFKMSTLAVNFWRLPFAFIFIIVPPPLAAAPPFLTLSPVFLKI